MKKYLSIVAALLLTSTVSAAPKPRPAPEEHTHAEYMTASDAYVAIDNAIADTGHISAVEAEAIVTIKLEAFDLEAAVQAYLASIDFVCEL